jgi:hypothetical protein
MRSQAHCLLLRPASRSRVADRLNIAARKARAHRLSLQLEKTASQAQLDAKEFWKHLEASAHEDL